MVKHAGGGEKQEHQHPILLYDTLACTLTYHCCPCFTYDCVSTVVARSVTSLSPIPPLLPSGQWDLGAMTGHALVGIPQGTFQSHRDVEIPPFRMITLLSLPPQWQLSPGPGSRAHAALTLGLGESNFVHKVTVVVPDTDLGCEYHKWSLTQTGVGYVRPILMASQTMEHDLGFQATQRFEVSMLQTGAPFTMHPAHAPGDGLPCHLRIMWEQTK